MILIIASYRGSQLTLHAVISASLRTHCSSSARENMTTARPNISPMVISSPLPPPPPPLAPGDNDGNEDWEDGDGGRAVGEES